jgi:hypothetical protein
VPIVAPGLRDMIAVIARYRAIRYLEVNVNFLRAHGKKKLCKLA